MKNLITILCLCLFWGSCESPTESEELIGVCIQFQNNTNRWTCYTNMSELECLMLEEGSNNESVGFFYNITCEEFCEQEFPEVGEGTPPHECSIVTDN